MADTMQGIYWALERPCPLRTGPRWTSPREAMKQVHNLHACTYSISRGKVIQNLIITSRRVQCVRDTVVELPYQGVPIEPFFAPVGGRARVVQTCAPCPANVAEPGPGVAAGCHGFFHVDPKAPITDELIRRTLHGRGLASEHARLFPATNSRYFGLWINSPLWKEQCALLVPLFEAFADSVSPEITWQRDNLASFLRALRASIRHDLPLHVEMSPPGHTDFGDYTVFAHCPRCKAECEKLRWKQDPAPTYAVCQVCGHAYDASKTMSVEPDGMADDDNVLERQMSEEAYDRLAYADCRARGHSDADVAEALDKHRDGPARRAVAAAKTETRRVHSRFSVPPGALDGRTRSRESITLDVGHGARMKLRLIHPGEFQMGCDNDSTARPAHPVRVADPFYLGVYPVTRREWCAVMEHRRIWRRSRLPIDKKTWLEAQEFCRRASERCGRVVRLPAEAEWEYACRAGTATDFAFGDVPALGQANIHPGGGEGFWKECAALFRGGRKRTRVDRYPPNAWGLYDMHGNAPEWCEDGWSPDYVEAPTDGSAYDLPKAVAGRRVARGGSADLVLSWCTSAARRPERADAPECGFRVVSPVCPTDSVAE